MLIDVDRRRCQGNGECVRAAPEVFELGDDGLRVLDDQPGEALRRAVQRAARRCPTQAITVSR